MSRLIDAEILFEKVGNIKPKNKSEYKLLGKFMNMITNSTTVKVQPCKTCLFWNTERKFCERWGALMDENSFCSRHKCVYDTEEYEAIQWEREWAKEHESK